MSRYEYERRVAKRHSQYDEHRPRHDVVDVYEGANRPVSYYDNGDYDRWQESSGPGRHHVSPFHTRHGAESQLVDVRPRPRSPSPVYRDNDDRVIIADRLKRTASTPNPLVGNARASKVRNESQHIPGLFQTVFDVNHPQDASVHLELPITDDFDAELEEFCRLQRLGNFGAAEDYFNDKLEPCLSNPYVFVHYGQMLLDKGDYLAFERLNPDAVFGEEFRPRVRERTVVIERERSRQRVRSRSQSRSRSRSWSRPREREREIIIRHRPQSPGEDVRQERRARFESDVRLARRRSRSRSQSVDKIRSYYERNREGESDRSYSPAGGPQLQAPKQESDYDEVELLRQNWRLLKVTSAIYSKGDYNDAEIEALYTIKNFAFGPEIGSTEIQVVKLALQLCAKIARIDAQWYHSDLREVARAWIDWPALAKELLIQGRIWDFKDFYVATIVVFPDLGESMLFGPDDIKRSLIDDWILDDGDESTNLALLDMFLEPGKLRSYFPDEAKARAEAIIAHSPKTMRSRSFIRWISANAADALSGEKKGDTDLWLASKTHFQGFAGLVWDTEDGFLPGIYVPRDTENPGWIAPELSFCVNEPLHLALNLAKELNDYNAQVVCYKLLIFQSQDPTKLFQELAHLQKSIQGDKKGHIETLLSSYLVCKDRPGKERLLHELEQTDDWGDATILRDGLTFWARDFIERAVKKSLQGPKSTVRLRKPVSFYMDKGLPLEAERFTWQTTELDRLPSTRDLPPPVTYIHQNAVLPARRQEEEALARTKTQPQALRDERYELAKLKRELEDLRIREERDAQRAEDAERWELRKSKLELEELRAREAREAREEESVRAKKELQALRERQAREVSDEHYRETRERLNEAEQRLRDQEKINAKQMEEMTRRDEEMKRLEQEFKQTKENQELEARAQQDLETRERLERAELSLRDQAERLRRSEDRSYQEWLTGRELRRKAKSRRKSIRGRGGTRFVAMSSASSDSYFSDKSSSQDDEDSSDDNSFQAKKKERARRSDSEDESGREVRVKRRVRGVYEVGNDPGRHEVNQESGDDTGHKQNTCTDLVLYREVQDFRSHGALTSPVSQHDEGRVDSRGRSTTGPEPTPEQNQPSAQQQTDQLTAEPQEVEDQVDQLESAASRSDTGETGDTGPSSVRGSDFRLRNELRSQEQNERIANRPSRHTSTTIYVGPPPSPVDSTDMETKREKAHRRVIVDPSPSGAHTVSARPRSRPSSTQVYDDIQPLGRRTSWRDSPASSPHGDRLKSPTKRRSLIIDADGRPQPVRTTSENHVNYRGESPRGTHVRVIRSDGADGVRPTPMPMSIPARPNAAAGSRSRPHSAGGIGGTRLHPPTGSERSAPERLPADSWERGQDGFWVKKKPSTLHEDPEEDEDEEVSQPQPQTKQGESSKDQDSLDPEQGVSRKSTVTDPEPSEE